MDTPSVWALVLSLVLALCSALAFVLIYLRSPWHRSALTISAAKMAMPRLAGQGQGHTQGQQTMHQPHATTHTTHAHLPHHNPSSHSSSASSGASHHPHSIHADLQQGTLAHALGTANHAQPLASSLSAAALQAQSNAAAVDLALRGRKAKKRGGRVHVTVAAHGGGVPIAHGGSNSASGGLGGERRTSRAASGHAPYVYPLDFLQAAPPVIVCLTTIPSRVHHIDKCLNSIKTQNYPIAQMMLAIPEESRREHTKYSIPDRVRKDAIISVVRVGQDYGPSTALITAWSAIPAGAQHSDTLIITLDDDQVYHPDVVATLVRHALAHPDAAVAFAGYSVRGQPFVQPNLAYAPTRNERPDLAFRQAQQSLQQQIAYAAAQQANAGAPSQALQQAAHQTPDPALLPPYDPLPDCTPDSDPYAAPLPNPNDVYDTVPVDVLCGWRGGMCCRKRFLDECLVSEYTAVGAPGEAAHWASDEWVSGQLAKNGAQRRVILAPFEPVLTRLRLRHGRNSASASHLAHQQTMLEYGVNEREWFGTTPTGAATTNGNIHRLVLESPTLPTTTTTTTTALPPSEQLLRLQQLMRPFRPETDGITDVGAAGPTTTTSPGELPSPTDTAAAATAAALTAASAASL